MLTAIKSILLGTSSEISRISDGIAGPMIFISGISGTETRIIDGIS